MTVAPAFATAVPLEPGGEAAALERALARAGSVLAAARPLAVALAEIQLPDLPDAPLGTPRDAATLRSIAPLYLAMEIEATGLTEAGSAIAGLFASGALPLSRGPAAETLMRYHRNYERRLPGADRQAAYLRLFGSAAANAAPFAADDAVNEGFEELLLALAEAMHRFAMSTPLDLAPPVGRREIARAAQALAHNLLQRGGGATPYIAEEALAVITEVVAIFRHREVLDALGARSLWDGVAAALALGAAAPRGPGGLGPLARARLTRGRAGLALITWLAEAAPQLASGLASAELDRSAPILGEGTAWLEATLSLLSQAADDGGLHG